MRPVFPISDDVPHPTSMIPGITILISKWDI